MLTLVRSRRRALCAATGSRSASSLVSGAAPNSSRRSSATSREYKNPFLSSDSSSDADEPPSPLLTLGSSYALFPGDVHCVLGVNGSGKSRFLAQLQRAAASQSAQPPTGESDKQQQRRRQRCRVGSLSLDAHRAFVALHGEKVVANVLGGVGSPSARDLIVRLGLYPVWESHVKHLSTGEMRKLMLAETLLKVPRANVLVLDQPFDGLDVAARKQLEWMLGQLTRGFTRLLVETGGRNDALAYRTQVLLVANRLEQVFPEILTHAVLLRSPVGDAVDSSCSSRAMSGSSSPAMEIVPCGDLLDDEVGQAALFDRLGAFFDEEQKRRPPMPHEEMVSLVQELFDCRTPTSPSTPDTRPTRAVELQQVSIAYDRRVLLDAVDFSRDRHEHWVLLGPNGSGKSSLMRVLMQTPGHGLTGGDVFIGSTKLGHDRESHEQQERVGAVSTDQHIRLLHQSVLEDEGEGSRRSALTSAFEMIAENARAVEKAQLAAKLLRLPEATLRSRSLAELSQGEQKLVLIARTLAACPHVLILDEITHGLDPFNRAHVLQVVNTIGTHATAATHLILITHHEDEITDCFTSVFEIRDKQLVERELQRSTIDKRV